jgi:hypothetical protein
MKPDKRKTEDNFDPIVWQRGYDAGRKALKRDRLPAIRCDICDNGVEPEWEFCAWCGCRENWKSVADDEGAK